MLVSPIANFAVAALKAGAVPEDVASRAPYWLSAAGLVFVILLAFCTASLLLLLSLLVFTPVGLEY